MCNYIFPQDDGFHFEDQEEKDHHDRIRKRIEEIKTEKSINKKNWNSIKEEKRAYLYNKEYNNINVDVFNENFTEKNYHHLRNRNNVNSNKTLFLSETNFNPRKYMPNKIFDEKDLRNGTKTTKSSNNWNSIKKDLHFLQDQAIKNSPMLIKKDLILYPKNVIESENNLQSINYIDKFKKKFTKKELLVNYSNKPKEKSVDYKGILSPLKTYVKNVSKSKSKNYSQNNIKNSLSLQLQMNPRARILSNDFLRENKNRNELKEQLNYIRTEEKKSSFGKVVQNSIFSNSKFNHTMSTVKIIDDSSQQQNDGKESICLDTYNSNSSKQQLTIFENIKKIIEKKEDQDDDYIKDTVPTEHLYNDLYEEQEIFLDKKIFDQEILDNPKFILNIPEMKKDLMDDQESFVGTRKELDFFQNLTGFINYFDNQGKCSNKQEPNLTKIESSKLIRNKKPIRKSSSVDMLQPNDYKCQRRIPEKSNNIFSEKFYHGSYYDYGQTNTVQISYKKIDFQKNRTASKSSLNLLSKSKPKSESKKSPRQKIESSVTPKHLVYNKSKNQNNLENQLHIYEPKQSSKTLHKHRNNSRNELNKQYHHKNSQIQSLEPSKKKSVNSNTSPKSHQKYFLGVENASFHSQSPYSKDKTKGVDQQKSQLKDQIKKNENLQNKNDVLNQKYFSCKTSLNKTRQQLLLEKINYQSSQIVLKNIIEMSSFKDPENKIININRIKQLLNDKAEENYYDLVRDFKTDDNNLISDKSKDYKSF